MPAPSRSDLLSAMAEALRQRFGPRLHHLFVLPEDPEHPEVVDYVFTFVAVVDARQEGEEMELVLNPGETDEADRPALVHVVSEAEYTEGGTDAASAARAAGTSL